MADNKQKLIQFLERKAWNPVLRASPRGLSDADRKRLERMQRKTESQKQRYAAYRGAGRVRQQFQDDLSSTPAKRTGAELEMLGLPTQRQVAKDFLALAERLGVKPARGPVTPHQPHPPHPWHVKTPERREQAKRQLTSMARRGDPEALRTLRTAPAKWARDLEQAIARGGPPKRRKTSAARQPSRRAGQTSRRRTT